MNAKPIIFETQAGYTGAVFLVYDHFYGYVRVPEWHPCAGRKYSEHIPALVSAHDRALEGRIGKRGILPIMARDRDEATMDVTFDVYGSVTFAGTHEELGPGWWIGFGCNHFGDSPEKCNEDYVRAEIESLAAQLKEVERPMSQQADTLSALTAAFPALAWTREVERLSGEVVYEAPLSRYVFVAVHDLRAGFDARVERSYRPRDRGYDVQVLAFALPATSAVEVAASALRTYLAQHEEAVETVRKVLA